MKKEYIQPECEIIDIRTESLIAASIPVSDTPGPSLSREAIYNTNTLPSGYTFFDED